jgi:hypothetical protein
MACHSVLLADVGGFAFILLPILVFAGFCVFAAVFGSAQAKQANEAWAKVASRLGLHLREGSFWSKPHMSGSIHGYSVEVECYTERHGKNNHTYTRVRIHFDSLQLGLSLQREGFLNTITKMFGLQQDLEVGDSGFDSEVIVQARDPEKLRQFLNTARRMRIRRYFTNYPQATITDSQVMCSVSGMLRNADQLQQMITSSVSVAWHLSAERKADENLTQALHAQEQGQTEEAWNLVHTARAERKPGEPIVAQWVEEEPIQAELIEERLIEGELLTLAGRTDEAHRVFQEARQTAPYDEEIAEWAEQPTAGPKSDVVEAVTSRAEEVPDPESQVAVADLCHDLFQESATSYQINHTFDRQYAGTLVHWTGTLKRIETFTYDFVFGNEPGTRVVIEVHELDNATYGDRTVSAIVRFPPELEGQLRERKSQQITFTGKLHKVDSLLRNIFVVEAELQ